MRHFLLLQGPHGPFYAQLAAKLRQSGQRVSRVAFNSGDCVEWPCLQDLLRYRDLPDQFDDWLTCVIAKQEVSDFVMYGDHRWMHRIAAQVAQRTGLRIHFLEEGYLRPHWVTYEREGVNGGSPLMNMPIEQVCALAEGAASHDRPAPDQWGAMGRHLWYGLRYHRAVARGARDWPNLVPTRGISLRQERIFALRSLLDLPARALRRRMAQYRLQRTGAPYHVALLQLGHDASVQAHSPYSDTKGFMRDVVEGFAVGAPSHHHLAFKLHPFEDGRENLHEIARQLTAEFSLMDRVHVVEGERLASLLDSANSVVTINSTAAQQALWRSLPVRAAGCAIYAKPGLVSNQSMQDFFAHPAPMDREAYLRFRRLLLATSQVKGGFYTMTGRATLLRSLVDMMLAEHGPYAHLDRDLAATAPIILPFAGRAKA